ncbi:MAG: LLM class flavin-dependent oxidoreductase [Gammaproteobacteria bacterium]|nr:LLM class flavin-dependent oxidoreductase [Gammaproteobacteria bacterium]
MKLAVEFPSVAYREGPEGIARLARAIEDLGFDQLDMFDHVVMGFPTADRPAGPYPPQMPILEAFMVLAYAAAATSRIGLGTEVLVLPQRPRCWWPNRPPLWTFSPADGSDWG